MKKDESTIGPYLPPGTLVRYDGWEHGVPEYGVVVHCWPDEEIGMHDCCVAFFGDKPPKGEPDEWPYVLRYSSVSLVVIHAVSDGDVVKAM